MNMQSIRDIVLSKDGIAVIICVITVLIAIIATRIVVKGVNNNSKWTERIGIGMIYLLFVLVVIASLIYFSVVDIDTLKAMLS